MKALRFVEAVVAVLTVLAVLGCSNTGNIGIDKPDTGNAGAGGTQNLALASQIVVSGASSVMAGACAPYTLQIVDGNGNPSNANGEATVFSVNPGAKIFSDAACVSNTSNVPVSASGAGAFFIKDTTRENLNVMATASLSNRSISGSKAVAVVGAPATVMHIAAPASNAINTCVPVSVSFVDAFGNLTGSHSDILVSLLSTGLAQSALYGEAGCMTPVVSGTVLSGADTKFFYAQANAIGTQNVRADAAGFSSVEVNLGWVAGATPRLLLTTAATATSGACTAVTLKSVRADGSDLVVAGAPVDATVSLLAGTATTFHVDAGCGAPLAGGLVSILPGSSSQIFYATTNLVPQVTTLSASSAGYVSGSAPINWVPVAAAQLAMTGVPASIDAGACGQGQVALLDALGNAAYVTAPRTIGMSATAASQVDFFSTSNCSGVPTLSLNLPMCVGVGVCNNTVPFSFRPKKIGPATLTAASTGLTSASALTNVSMATGNASQLVITRLTDPARAGSCLQYLVQTKDAFGNFINAGPAALSLAATASSASNLGAFYSEGSCSVVSNTVVIPVGQHEAMFFFKDPRVETATLTLSGSPTPVGQSTVSLLVNDPAKLVFNFLPVSSQASRCSSPISVTQKDAFDNVTGVAVSYGLAATNGVVFYSDAGCTQMITAGSIAAGNTTSSLFYFSGPNQGNAQLSATATSPSSILVAAVGDVLMTAAPASRVALSCTQNDFLNPGCTTLAAGACRALHVASLDASNALYLPVGGGVTVAMTSSGTNQAMFFTNPLCTTALAGNSLTLANGSHPRTIYVRNTVAESLVLTGTPSVGSAGTAPHVTTAAAPLKLVLSTTQGPASIFTGTCSGPYEMKLEDQFGNASPASASTVYNFLSSRLNGAGVDVANTFFADNACANNATLFASGASTSQFYIKSATAGTLNIVGSSANLSSSNSRDVLISQAARVAFFSGATEVSGVNFGTVVVGSPSNTQVLEVKNISSADTASLQALALAAPYERVAALSTCPTTSFQLVGGQSCALAVRYVPTAVGSQPGTLVATYTSAQNAASRSATVNLNGSGVNPNLVAPYLSFSSISFGSVQVASTANQAISLVNPNAYAISINGQTAPAAAFVVTASGATPCPTAYPFNLAANTSCTLNIAFTPVAATNYSSSMSFQSSAGSTNTTALSGIGYSLPGTTLTISPNSHNFGTVALNTTSSTVFFNLTNVGSQAADSISFDNFQLPFAISLGSCSGTLPVGSTCTFSATFRPTASANYSASVRLNFRNVSTGATTNFANALVLSGQGGSTVTAANLVFDIPVGVYFYNIQLYSTASYWVLVTNNGQTAATTATISKSGSSQFSVVSSTCGNTIAAGESCWLRTSFTPTSYGWSYGSFWVNYYSGSTYKSTSTLQLQGYAY